MFKSVLVANRGEIAVRICNTLRRMGIRSVVVVSIPDRRSLAARSADAVVLLEGYSATESYLDVDAVIAAARSEGCEAIHPGYGFLSERADFAERCLQENITFIGPNVEVLRGMGDKAAARRLAVANGVPVVPGWDGDDDPDTLTREAARIGYPVMLKARGGGGGRGMREVHSGDELAEAIDSARREALAAFGDGGLLLEKLVVNAHHVEVQVLADTHGNVIHLGERDCSVQRRRQKLIEETPSPVVDNALRQRLTGHALGLARAINYVNAGTFEFLVDTTPDPRGAGDEGPPVYFLEVNPRLQVEHPVTEMVTGVDLVELQLRIAAGEPLPLRQQDVRFEGHALELRVNAEDPWDGFKPSSGRLAGLRAPTTGRCDTGFEQGDTIPPQYDSLVMKLVFHGEDRAAAVASALAGVRNDDVVGIGSNLALLAAICRSETFAAGRCTIDWLERELDGLLASARRLPRDWAFAAAAFAARADAGAAWHGAGCPALWLSDGVETRLVELARQRTAGTERPSAGRVTSGSALVDGTGYEFALWAEDGGVIVEAFGERTRLSVREGRVEVAPNQFVWVVPPPPLPRRAHASSASATAVTAPLAGTIAAIRVSEGDSVSAGHLLVLLEAMKMEHRITAPAHGVVKAVLVHERDVVREGDVLVELG